jgi:glycosyltransferase involved in cell wall biosynthesis
MVATSVGDLPNVIADGVSGALVAPGDEAALAGTLTRLATQPDLRARLAREASAVVRARFGQDAMIDAYLDAYGLPVDARALPSA